MRVAYLKACHLLYITCCGTGTAEWIIPTVYCALFYSIGIVLRNCEELIQYLILYQLYRRGNAYLTN
jgi:hypothetical protein